MSDSDQASTCASVVAMLAVTCALGLLYVPVVFR
jgi:hypothetical protein